MAGLKSKLVPLVAGAILITGGTVAVVSLVNKDDDQKTAQNQAKDPTLDELLTNTAKYKDKEVTVHGSMVQIGFEGPAQSPTPTKSYLLMTPGNQPKAIKLDFSQSKADPSQLAITASPAPEQAPTGPTPIPPVNVTVTGTLKRDTKNPSDNLRFVVKSISKKS